MTMSSNSQANSNDFDESNKIIHSVNVDSISFSDRGEMTISCAKTKIAIQRAAQAIKSEQLVAFPTETVYGLGASALCSKSVSKIFKTKGRPSDNPLIIHISSLEVLKQINLPASSSNNNNINSKEWELPLIYQVLIRSFWPGPLTLLMPIPESGSATCLISELVTCGLRTVGVRMPAHPIARALLTEAGIPIAAPSANLSGRPSPTTAQHVHNDFGTKVPIILDGGECLVGVESTVVDGLNLDGRLRILRLGGLSVESIQLCLSQAGLLHLNDGSSTILHAYNQNYLQIDFIPSTPGMKYKHYSPSAQVILLNPVSSSSHHQNSNNHSIPNVDELLSSLESELEATKKDLCMKIGLMMIEGSELAEEFEQYDSSNGKNQQTTSSKRLKLIKSNMGKIDEPDKSAKRLYGSLRYLDESCGVDYILVESLPTLGLGKTVMERLAKASGHRPPIDILLSHL